MIQRTCQSHNINIPPGVRYAEPPTGDLRFKKPVAASWTGEKLAQKAEIICLQYGFSKSAPQSERPEAVWAC